MAENIIKIIEQQQAHGMTYMIAETAYEFGTHYVLFVNGQPGFHSTELERVRKYMQSWM